MPGFNGTGPGGMGPMTGGGRGFCNSGRGFRQPFGGYGMRQGGRGYARYGVRPVYPENMAAASPVELVDDLESLRQQAQDVKAQLAELQTRIEQMGEKA
ncbi:DUF5320 domain-containing protein [Chloroflexota bacterium]